MNWEDITICVLVIIILYFLFKDKKENLENVEKKEDQKEYYKALCEKTTDIHNKAQEYLGNNCSEEKTEELKNFRGSINSRSWCRLKGEEEITSDINKDTWCELAKTEPTEILAGYMPINVENLSEYEHQKE